MTEREKNDLLAECIGAIIKQDIEEHGDPPEPVAVQEVAFTTARPDIAETFTRPAPDLAAQFEAQEEPFAIEPAPDSPAGFMQVAVDAERLRPLKAFATRTDKGDLATRNALLEELHAEYLDMVAGPNPLPLSPTEGLFWEHFWEHRDKFEPPSLRYLQAVKRSYERLRRAAPLYQEQCELNLYGDSEFAHGELSAVAERLRRLAENAGELNLEEEATAQAGGLATSLNSIFEEFGGHWLYRNEQEGPKKALEWRRRAEGVAEVLDGAAGDYALKNALPVVHYPLFVVETATQQLDLWRNEGGVAAGVNPIGPYFIAFSKDLYVRACAANNGNCPYAVSYPLDQFIKAVLALGDRRFRSRRDVIAALQDISERGKRPVRLKGLITSFLINLIIDIENDHLVIVSGVLAKLVTAEYVKIGKARKAGRRWLPIAYALEEEEDAQARFKHDLEKVLMEFAARKERLQIAYMLELLHILKDERQGDKGFWEKLARAVVPLLAPTSNIAKYFKNFKAGGEGFLVLKGLVAKRNTANQAQRERRAAGVTERTTTKGRTLSKRVVHYDRLYIEFEHCGPANPDTIATIEKGREAARIHAVAVETSKANRAEKKAKAAKAKAARRAKK